jgi:hypothetical protein
MGMGVYRPGKNVFSLGIDDFIGRVVKIGADGFDCVTLGKHIGGVTAGSVYDGSTLK